MCSVPPSNIRFYFTGAKESSGLEIGDYAVSENIVPCWDCRYCKRGDYNMCELTVLSLTTQMIQ